MWLQLVGSNIVYLFLTSFRDELYFRTAPTRLELRPSPLALSLHNFN